MLSEQLKQLLSQFDREIYMDREGRPCIKHIHDQYNPNKQKLNFEQSGCSYVYIEPENKAEINLANVNNSIVITKITSTQPNSKLEFMVECAKEQGYRAAITIQQSFGDGFDYVLQISLNKNGDIEVFSNQEGSKKYSYNEMLQTGEKTQGASLAELSIYLQKTDKRLIPIIKYCASIINSFKLSSIANAIDTRPGKARLLSKPNMQYSVPCSADSNSNRKIA